MSFCHLWDYSVSLVTFFGALRISEAVARSKADTTQLALQRQDIFIESNTLFSHIHRSKVDQRGKGVHIALGRCSMNTVCSVLATVAYLTFRGQHPGYFFVHSDGSPLTNASFGN